MTRPDTGMVTGVGVCPTCGKQCFTSKVNAKKAIRQLRGRIGRLHAYRCDRHWHIGHLPAAVTQGVLTRDQLGPARPKEIS